MKIVFEFSPETSWMFYDIDESLNLAGLTNAVSHIRNYNDGLTALSNLRDLGLDLKAIDPTIGWKIVMNEAEIDISYSDFVRSDGVKIYQITADIRERSKQ